MKTLVVAEKPSVGRDIARVLKCTQKGEGYLSGESYVVSWAIGHLAELLEPEDYDPAYKKWRMEHLPILPEPMRCKAVAKTRPQLKVLHKLMNAPDTEMIICATDSGREGELIFRYIYQLTRCTKPFKRLWISSMTDAAITEGFNRLRDGREYDALYTSAKCRSEADWLVGMNASRAYTIQYGTLLSVGRVQTPTLALITKRQQEINAFVPEDYWEVKAAFEASQDRRYEGLLFTENAEGQPETRRTDREQAALAAEQVRGRPGVVERVKTEEKRQPPPQLFDLTELQRECNRKLGFSAQKTLSLAQALYEKHKLITYPRTDSRYLSRDLVPKLPAVLKALQPEYPAAEYVLGLDSLPVTGRIVNDAKVTDHHAIIPTGIKPPSALTKDERAVYDRIARKFLAAFYPPYIYLATTVITAVKGEGFTHTFLSKGQTVTDEGWTSLYKHEKNDADREAQGGPLPKLLKGDAAAVKSSEVLQKKTQPPKAYTEATLLSAMENAGRFTEDEALKEALKDSGLGTPATRAAVIERLIAVGYVNRQRKNLIPTEKGMRLTDIVPKELSSPETTGKWERSLSRIARGETDDARFMDSIKRYVAYIIESAAAGDATEKQNLFPKEERRGKRKSTKAHRAPICACPSCETGQVYENSKAYYCGNWKDGCKFTLWKSVLEKEGKTADDATVQAECDKMRKKKG